MSEKIKLSIKFCGALRQYVEDDEFCLMLSKKTSLLHIRQLIISKIREQHQSFNNDSLFDHSAFANETKILQEDQIIDCDSRLTVLPPVCGG